MRIDRWPSAAGFPVCGDRGSAPRPGSARHRDRGPPRDPASLMWAAAISRGSEPTIAAVSGEAALAMCANPVPAAAGMLLALIASTPPPSDSANHGDLLLSPLVRDAPPVVAMFSAPASGGECHRAAVRLAM
jgi:hypothetical protein